LVWGQQKKSRNAAFLNYNANYYNKQTSISAPSTGATLKEISVVDRV
jgi:hypothetical protein